MRRPHGLLPLLSLVVAFIAIGLGLALAWAQAGPARAAPDPARTPPCPPAWAVAPSTNAGTGGNSLEGLAVLSPTNMWAVGSYYAPAMNRTQTLVEHWDGTSWTVVPSPNAGTSDNLLLGVTAIAANDIWAVGHSGVDPDMVTLTEHWDGSTWTIVPSPNPGPDQNRLWAVAAAGPNDVWAVGDSGVSLEPNNTVILHWNGSAWLPSPSPDGGPFENGLFGVAVVNSNDVWAVGLACCFSANQYTLTEHWDGTTWSVIPSAPAGADSDFLDGVVALASDNVWAVGSQHFDEVSLILHWDGTAWTPVASPSPGITGDHLAAVSALAPDDIWTVGWSVGPSNEATTLTAHWDGSAWTQVPSPNVGPHFNELAAVGALGPQDVWAVGHTDVFQPPVTVQTLVEHYTGSCVPSTTATPAGTATTTRPPSATATRPPATPTARPATATPAPTQPASPVPATATPAAQTATPVPATATAPPATASPGQTATAAPATATASSSPAPCAVSFSDVRSSDYFYTPVLYLACHGVISGYGDGTFRPYNNTTRGQMVKIVVLGFGKPVTTPAGGGYTFADVPPGAPFFDVIETAAADQIVSGYTCGGPGEPCDAQQRPYFRPNASVTRGQLSKIDVVAAGWGLQTPATATFTDVPASSPFYAFVETAACHGVISGYGDRTFRPFADATRGQIAKIVYLSLTASGGCDLAL